MCVTMILVCMLLYLVTDSLGYPMKISFCDGNRYMELTHDHCPYGINFGDSKPGCVCIKGAYRMWLDNCAVYDGFMEEGCSTLKQGDFSVTGLRLTGSVESLLNTTAVILGLKETDYQVWNTFSVGSIVETAANSIYVVNGIATFSDNHICIHPKKEISTRKQVCRIFRSNNPIWKTGIINVEVAVSCPQNSVQLHVQNCYDVIHKGEHSECSLSCKTPHNGHKVGSAGLPLGPPSLLREDFKKEENGNCRTPVIADTRDEKNRYINRNLNRWAKLRQVKDVDRPNLLNLVPRRSWGIFDIMKQITQEKCPPTYVSQLFMDQAVDLFIMIHQGKGIRHPEVLNENEHDKILAKLNYCKASNAGKHLPMYGSDSVDGCGPFEQLMGASIPHPPGQVEFFINETIEIDQSFYKYDYHFVIDAAWKIVDMVQNVCLDSFTDEFYLFHTWAYAMEKLFNRQVKDLWFYPQVDVRVYQILLSPSAVTDLHNLEMCVLAAYMTDPRLKRLKRPKPVRTMFRKKRSMEGIVTRIHDVHCQQSERDFQYPC